MSDLVSLCVPKHNYHLTSMATDMLKNNIYIIIIFFLNVLAMKIYILVRVPWFLMAANIQGGRDKPMAKKL